MKKLALAAGVLLAVGTAVWWCWKWATTDEAAIRKQLQALAANASFTAEDGLLARAAKASRLIEAFSPSVTVRLTRSGDVGVDLNGRGQLTEQVSLLHRHLRSLQVQFPDVAVNVASDRTNAIALLTAEAKLNHQRELNLFELKVHLQKVQGRWLIVRVEDYRTLEP